VGWFLSGAKAGEQPIRRFAFGPGTIELSVARLGVDYAKRRAALHENVLVLSTLHLRQPLRLAGRFFSFLTVSGRRLALLSLVALSINLLTAPRATALTLDDLRTEIGLTPERFVRYFADFKFELGEVVRKPEVFLAKRSGDCDDFATLAASVLSERGYTTHLVVVFMQKDVHVVCYVSQVKAFLDYNLRRHEAPLVPSDGSLKDIAAKVAGSFREEWYSVSEFTYDKGVRRFLLTDFN
jgi:hypothetical protein